METLIERRDLAPDEGEVFWAVADREVPNHGEIQGTEVVEENVADIVIGIRGERARTKLSDRHSNSLIKATR